jgi:hypothetical protein
MSKALWTTLARPEGLARTVDKTAGGGSSLPPVEILAVSLRPLAQQTEDTVQTLPLARWQLRKMVRTGQVPYRGEIDADAESVRRLAAKMANAIGGSSRPPKLNNDISPCWNRGEGCSKLPGLLAYGGTCSCRRIEPSVPPSDRCLRAMPVVPGLSVECLRDPLLRSDRSRWSASKHACERVGSCSSSKPLASRHRFGEGRCQRRY